MKIFIASSRESLDLVREMEVWLEEQGHEPIPWDKPGLFMPGEQTFKVLMELSRNVEAAIFVFGGDDRVWYRGDTVPQPRDNVLIEYGLFAGMLGPQKAIVCRDGDPKHPVDLAGLTSIDVSGARRARGKLELSIWARRLTTSPMDPAILRLQAKVEELEREKEQLADRLGFESDKARDLAAILGDAKVVDFSQYDLASDGHWKLLFDFAYFHDVASQIARTAGDPVALRSLFTEAGAAFASHGISWQSAGGGSSPELSRDRTPFLARKLLRRMREAAKAPVYLEFVKRVPESLGKTIAESGMRSAKRLSAKPK